MIERVAAELGVTPGKRYAHTHGLPYHKPSGTQRPRAYEQAVSRRALIDAHYTRHPLNTRGQETTPFFVGSAVLCRGQLGTISHFASG
eukprot:7377564-Prymnesium_polylepis.1